ncbi:MAG: hypothetical protein ACKOWD_09940 [Rhodoferax sp.]
MPRKRTIQPAPRETFVLDDGTTVEVRDRDTREIGRGLDKKFNSEELDWQVVNGLVDDLRSGNHDRILRAQSALASNYAMERFLYEAGYDDMEERTRRRHGKTIRQKLAQTLQIVATVEYESWKVPSAPCTSD